ncbi:MAG: murein biosynthesis integral membrane protein MurJ [Bryobacter sp.]|nr:murein biosynthesis integral membrane protein MurJ [Bryobacter sp.]
MTPKAPSPASSTEVSQGVVRSASIMSFAVALSRVSGLVREMVMSRLFGASMPYDAFRIGFQIPNLTRDLFAEGALSSAFVPVFTDYLQNKGREEAARLANLVTTTLILVVGTLCAAGALASAHLVRLAAAGFANTPGKAELAAHLTSIMFPFLLLVALAAQAMGILNALKQFAVPALSSTFFNIGSVAAGLVLGLGLGPQLAITPIEGMAWGVLVGGALQLGFQIPALVRAGFRFRPALDFSHPGLRSILVMMGPAILGNAATQINVLVNSSLASTIVDPLRGADGPVSWLGYAFRFMQLPIGLFGVAIASATLPAISRSASAGNLDEFRRTLSRSLGLVFLLTIPSSVGLVLVGRAMIGAVYEGFKFQAYDTEQTAVALSGFCIGLAGYSAQKVLAPSFYALKDARTPMLVSLASVMVNFSLAWFLVRVLGFGHAGLALATSGIAIFTSLTLFLLIRRRAEGLYGRMLFESLWRVLAASAAMGAAVWALVRWLESAPYVLQLALAIPAGVVVFYAACRALRIEELALATEAFAGPLARRFPRWFKPTP